MECSQQKPLARKGLQPDGAARLSRNGLSGFDGFAIGIEPQEARWDIISCKVVLPREFRGNIRKIKGESQSVFVENKKGVTMWCPRQH